MRPRDGWDDLAGCFIGCFVVLACILGSLLGWAAWSVVFWGVARLFGGA